MITFQTLTPPSIFGDQCWYLKENRKRPTRPQANAALLIMRHLASGPLRLLRDSPLERAAVRHLVWEALQGTMADTLEPERYIWVGAPL